MVDNRAAGFYGVAGAFNFKSGDISGTAAKTRDDRESPGTEYGRIDREEAPQEFNSNRYVDNSAQLNATLNSLAMLNVASVINSKIPKYHINPDLEKILSDAQEFVAEVSSEEEHKNSNHKEEDSDDAEEKEAQIVDEDSVDEVDGVDEDIFSDDLDDDNEYY